MMANTNIEYTYNRRGVKHSQNHNHNHHHDEDGRKKRVGKACDSCRMKKTKCDGRKPCSKCSQDNKLCTYSEKKKLQERTYSSGYVELLEYRIQILQDSVIKLVSKIANSEDISHYIPQDGELSINRVIDLLMDEDSEDEEDEHGKKLREQARPIVRPPPETTSPVSETSAPENSLEDLGLGPYKSGAAMAAAAADSIGGGYSIPLPSSPQKSERRRSSFSNHFSKVHRPGHRTTSDDESSPSTAGSPYTYQRRSHSSNGMRKPVNRSNLGVESMSTNTISPESITPPNESGFFMMPPTTATTTATTASFMSPSLLTTAEDNDPLSISREQLLQDLKNQPQYPGFGQIDEINSTLDDLWLGTTVNAPPAGFYNTNEF